jgi:hypothetical protein
MGSFFNTPESIALINLLPKQQRKREQKIFKQKKANQKEG